MSEPPRAPFLCLRVEHQHETTLTGRPWVGMENIITRRCWTTGTYRRYGQHKWDQESIWRHTGAGLDVTNYQQDIGWFARSNKVWDSSHLESDTQKDGSLITSTTLTASTSVTKAFGILSFPTGRRVQRKFQGIKAANLQPTPLHWMRIAQGMIITF